MVARSESMFGCYDSYSYRLWSLANVWSTCHFPALTNGVSKEGEEASNGDFIKCPQCQKGCGSFQALKEHIEVCHPHAIPEEASPAPLPPTLPVTSSPPPAGPYACSQCTSSFSTKDQLEKHELLHSPNAQVSCKVCHKTFANVYRLQRHMISHDESAILRKFKCTECEKAFKFKHHLKEHIRIHSGEKPFECANCGKRFSHSGSYSSHMTSKKCLVMNLKMGRNRAGSGTNSLLDKNSSQTSRGSKRPNTTALNNNITTSPNHNSYLPILPKYNEAAAAAFLSVIAPRDAAYPQPASAAASLHPFYMTPPGLHLGAATHPISPYTMSASLGQLLEQLQTNASAHSPKPNPAEPLDDTRPTSTPVTTEDDHKETSSNSELVMDTEEVDKEEENNRAPSPENNSSDLEAVKRILETVNATVTKQFLQANMQKMSADSPNNSDCRSTASPALSVDEKNQFHCNLCKKQFASQSEIDSHECECSIEIKSEGLAAKLEEAVHVKSEDVSMNGNMSGTEEDHDIDSKHNDKSHDDYDIDNESVTTTDHVAEDGRKVRVRSLIADEQLTILKDHYAINPRPKREELARIAERIGFPVRVVQVWFQNTRARDRREGRLVQIPYSPIPSATLASCFPQSIVPSTPPHIALRTLPYGQTSPQYQSNSEQPLDLSTKKGPLSVTSSPSSSPQRPTSAIAHSDSGEEAVNLSHKSSRSPTPFHQLPYQPVHYQSSNCSSDYHRSPSPLPLHQDAFTNGSRLARILAQPAHRLAMAGVSSAMGLPMDRLLQYNPDLRSPLLSAASPSPNSDKRSWKMEENDDSGVSQEMYTADDDTSCPTKKNKITLPIKSLNSVLLTPGAPEPEIEGQFVCDQCDKAFSKQSSLARHKYEHSGQRPHKCNECPKAFKHKHHLTEHKRLHSGEKPFQCSKCLKRFSHSGSYSQHMNHRYSYCKPYRE